MWLSNVVIIITFIFLILQILLKIRKQNRLFMYVLLGISIAFELLFVLAIIFKYNLHLALQVVIFVFSYLVPMGIVALNSTNVYFRLKILYAVARLAYSLKKYEFTAGILYGAIKNDKYNSKYYYLRGKALDKMGDLAGARDMLFKVIELDKESKEVYLELAQILDMEDKKDTALIMLVQVLKLYPDYVEAKEMMGIIYSEIGRDNEAESIYEKLIASDTATYNTYYNMAIIYCRQGQIDKAIESYNIALDKNSKLYEANYALGKLYYAKENFEESIENLKKALKEESLKAKAEYALSMTYIKMDDLEKAVEHLENAIKLDINYLYIAKQTELFEAISLELNRLEDENRELISVTYDSNEELEEKTI